MYLMNKTVLLESFYFSDYVPQHTFRIWYHYPQSPGPHFIPTVGFLCCLPLTLGGGGEPQRASHSYFAGEPWGHANFATAGSAFTRDPEGDFLTLIKFVPRWSRVLLVLFS